MQVTELEYIILMWQWDCWIESYNIYIIHIYMHIHTYILAHKPKQSTHTHIHQLHTYLCSIKINIQWGLKAWKPFPETFCAPKRGVRLSVVDCWAEEWGSLVMNRQGYIYPKYRDPYTLLQIKTLIRLHQSFVGIVQYINCSITEHLGSFSLTLILSLLWK